MASDTRKTWCNRRLHTSSPWPHLVQFSKPVTPAPKDLYWRSRFGSKIDLYNGWNNLVDMEGHPVLAASDYMMFNKQGGLTAYNIGSMLELCRVRLLPSDTVELDGWSFRSWFGSALNYCIEHHPERDLRTVPFVSSPEEKRMAVRVMLTIMNETPDELVNLDNYEVIAAFEKSNDLLLQRANNARSCAAYVAKKAAQPEPPIPTEPIKLHGRVGRTEILRLLFRHAVGGELDRAAGMDVYAPLIPAAQFPDTPHVESVEDAVLNARVPENAQEIDLAGYAAANGARRTQEVVEVLKRYVSTRYRVPAPLTAAETLAAIARVPVEHAETHLPYADYVNGHRVKVDFGTFPILDVDRYERCYGSGAFERHLFEGRMGTNAE